MNIKQYFYIVLDSITILACLILLYTNYKYNHTSSHIKHAHSLYNISYNLLLLVIIGLISYFLYKDIKHLHSANNNNNNNHSEHEDQNKILQQSVKFNMAKNKYKYNQINDKTTADYIVEHDGSSLLSPHNNSNTKDDARTTYMKHIAKLSYPTLSDNHINTHDCMNDINTLNNKYSCNQ